MRQEDQTRAKFNIARERARSLIEGRNKTKLGKKTPTDSVYRAAILAARDLDTASDTTRSSAGVALAATLDRHGVRLGGAPGKTAIKSMPGILELADAEGIVISVPGEDRPTEWAAIARQNHWQRAHLIHFAPRTLSIRTVAV